MVMITDLIVMYTLTTITYKLTTNHPDMSISQTINYMWNFPIAKELVNSHFK